jgi:hypothetical protein
MDGFTDRTRSDSAIANLVRIHNKVLLRQTLFAGTPCLHLFGEQKRGSTESRETWINWDALGVLQQLGVVAVHGIDPR